MWRRNRIPRKDGRWVAEFVTQVAASGKGKQTYFTWKRGISFYGAESVCAFLYITSLPLRNMDVKVTIKTVTAMKIKMNITERRITVVSGSKGSCYICGAELGKTAMKNHILKAHGGENGGQECIMLKTEGAYDKNYWLYIDLPADGSLSDVDKFLRKIWLECCGHLSEFSGPGHRKIAKSRKLNSFSAGDQLLHEYDFGTPTETLITVVGAIERTPQREKVRLIARNVPPQFKCVECGSPANYICTQCVFDSDNPFYCAACGEKHEHDEMLLLVTNSPRMGECGYDGELDTFTFVPLGTQAGGRNA